MLGNIDAFDWHIARKGEHVGDEGVLRSVCGSIDGFVGHEVYNMWFVFWEFLPLGRVDRLCR